MGLRVAKFRRLWNVEEQFLLTATIQNIKKMAKLLHKGNKEAIQGMANFSNLCHQWFRFIIIDFSKTILFASGKPVDNILLLLAHGRV